MTQAFDPNAAAPADSGIFGLPHTPEEAQVVLIPVPWEATTSYRPGTAGGPQAILEASRQVDLYDLETGKPYEGGIALLPEAPNIGGWNTEARQLAEPIIERGGDLAGDEALADELASVNELCARVNAWVKSETERWLAAGKIVGVVGGDHAVPFGAIEALARRHPGMGVLHVDAHADLRAAYEGFTWSHASIMHNVMTRIPAVSRLVQVGIRDVGENEVDMIRASAGRIIDHYDAELAARRFEGETWAAQCKEIIAPLPDEVYVSFDIDGLDPSQCPSTGTPVPGGLSFQQATYLLRALVASGRRIVGFDLCETAPGPTEWDANVASRLLYKLVGWTVKSRTRKT